MHKKSKILMALLLASGMAFAQSGSNSGSGAPGQPSTQQPSSNSPSADPDSQSPQQPPSAQQQSPSANPDKSSQTSSPSRATGQMTTGQSSISGCLKQSGNGWVVVSNGQRTPVTGDDATLKPNDGRQVQLKGSQASDGSFQVSEIELLSDACVSGSSGSSNLAPGSTAAAGAAGGTVSQETAINNSAAGANPRSTTDQNAGTSTNITGEDPSSPQTSSVTENPSSTANSSSSAQAEPAHTDEQTASTTPTTQQPSANAQPSDKSQATENTEKLPQTASPLPLLGLIGMGSMAAGLIARRKR